MGWNIFQKSRRKQNKSNHRVSNEQHFFDKSKYELLTGYENKSIYVLSVYLPEQVLNALLNAGINTVGDLYNRSDELSNSIDRMGYKSLQSIKIALLGVTQEKSKRLNKNDVYDNDTLPKNVYKLPEKMTSKKYGGKSIYNFMFSERTLNALRNVGLTKAVDLWHYRDFFATAVNESSNDVYLPTVTGDRIKIRGLGRKGILEVYDIILSMEDGEWETEINYETNKQVDINKAYKRDEVEYIPWNIFIEKHDGYYFPIKRNKISGNFSEKSRGGYLEINNYLQSVYFKNEDFSFQKFCAVLYDNLDNVEIALLEKRLGMVGLDVDKKTTLDDLASEFNITRERIRQKEGILLDKISDVFKKFSETKIGEIFIAEFLTKNNINDYGIIDCSRESVGRLNGKFLGTAYSEMLRSKYNSQVFEGKIILLYNNNIFTDSLINKILEQLTKKYQEKRIEDISVSGYDLYKNSLGDTIDDYTKKGCEYIIGKYLLYQYGIVKYDGFYIFKRNRKNLPQLVEKEFELINKPIHFTDMYKIMVEKYPKLNWSAEKVHSALSKYGKNVGNGLFVHSSHKMKGGSIIELAEDYLNQKQQPVPLDEIVNYVLKNKIVTEGSVRSMILSQDKEHRFISFNGKIALKKWGIKDDFDESLVNSELKNQFSDDIYTLKQAKNILFSNNFNLNESYAIFEALGYNVWTGYILKRRYRSFTAYIEDKVKHGSIIRLDKDLLKYLPIYRIITDTCKEYKLFKINDELYISYIKMDEKGVTSDYIKRFFLELKDKFNDSSYFSIKNIKNNIDTTIIEKLGFEDSFLENIISFNNEISTIRINGHKLFSYDLSKTKTMHFINDMMSKYRVISLYDFAELINKEYNLDLDYDIIKKYTYDIVCNYNKGISSVYYNPTLEKLYLNKQDFYNEIYDNDGN